VQADFFNNVASIAIVLLFTKAVTHRVRQGEPKTQAGGTTYHMVTVIAAAAAVVVSLVATAVHSEALWFYILSWATLGVAGLMLVFDDWRQAHQPSAPTGLPQSPTGAEPKPSG